MFLEWDLLNFLIVHLHDDCWRLFLICISNFCWACQFDFYFCLKMIEDFIYADLLCFVVGCASNFFGIFCWRLLLGGLDCFCGSFCLVYLKLRPTWSDCHFTDLRTCLKDRWLEFFWVESASWQDDLYFHVLSWLIWIFQVYYPLNLFLELIEVVRDDFLGDSLNFFLMTSFLVLSCLESALFGVVFVRIMCTFC